MDYYDDVEMAVFHEIIAEETCIRNCIDKEVEYCIIVVIPSFYFSPLCM